VRGKMDKTFKILKDNLNGVGMNENKNLIYSFDKKSICIIGMGDVGSNLALGLRLLGNDIISRIGIYDPDNNKVKRFVTELSQIYALGYTDFPKVEPVIFDDIFSYDNVVFLASKNVPQVGSNIEDVRLVQFESNGEMLIEYGNNAVKKGFKGKFMIVSDPVDLLCTLVKDRCNSLDVIGFGQGVMYARAKYHSNRLGIDSHGLRIFGPHGSFIRVVNDIYNFDKELSKKLSELTRDSNLEIRELGFKPYIAPSMSSGTLSILEYLRGNTTYASYPIEGIFYGTMGYYDILQEQDVILKESLSDEIIEFISDSYNEVKDIYEKSIFVKFKSK
jgi:hypothetical protein